MERIAVIIPVHNRLSMLLRAIRSVLEQSRRPDELVIVDDGSTDDLSAARELVTEAGGHWIRLEPKAGGKTHGPGPARNAGVAGSESEWISFLDSDDEWFPEKLASQLCWHRNNRETLISQVEEEWVRNGRALQKPKHLQQPSGDVFAESCARCAIGPSCTMMHRRLWDQFGGFDPRFHVCEDYELWLRISSRSPVGLIPGGVLSRKQGGHEDQLSTTTPLLERYRLLALLEFLRCERGTEAQQGIVWREIRRFADQLSRYSESKRKGDWIPVLTALQSSEDPSESLIRELWSILLREPNHDL